jgi:peptide-methionine (S)-S-oxide reductase
MTENPASLSCAYFGGGCFWCLEAVFEGRPGVCDVISGYAGGTTPDPDYEAVGTGETGHAEMIKILYDTAQTDYRTLLDLFFRAHDPTTVDRQGADTGSQYRSIILYCSDDERLAAQAAKDQAAAGYGRPAVTEIAPFTVFYKAEEYHQNFFRTNPGQGYCMFVIRPKMKKLGFE